MDVKDIKAVIGTNATKNPSGTSCRSYRGKELTFAAYKTRNIHPIKLILKEKELRLREINSDKDVEEEHIIKVENGEG